MIKPNSIGILNPVGRKGLSGFATTAGVLLLGLIVGVVSTVSSLHMELVLTTILITCMFLSIYISKFRPNSLLPFIILMWVISPEIRRVIDWLFGVYSQVSIASIIPYCVSLTLVPAIIKNIKFLDKRLKGIAILMGVVLTYGFLIGITKYGVASVFELLNYVVPFLIVLYVNVSSFNIDVRNRWLKSLSVIGVLAAGYGIFQYMALPPWDKFWMMNTDMNSIGIPEPQNFRVFSTINSPGPTGVFLAFSLAIMVLHKKARFLGLVGIMIVGFALLLTLVRSGWLAFVFLILAYLIRSQLKQKIILITILGIIGLFYQFLLPYLPGASTITLRIATLGSLEGDHSFNERLDFTSSIFSFILSNPIGTGLGGTGIAAKVSSHSSAFVVFDNGYLNILYTFGFPLGLLLIAALIYLTIYFFRLSRLDKRYYPISFATIVACLFLLLGNNVLTGLNGVILWFLSSLSFYNETPQLSTKNNKAKEITLRPAFKVTK